MNEINISKNNLINHSKEYQRCINSTIENQFNNIENTTKSNSNAFELETVENRMYEKVIRENRVIKVVKGAVKVKRGN